ncbi:hypothetical protein GPALN_010747 [Globodera pallida]|nr:hypothetical protein GPALN_010747 [Globodera pallida]
MSDNKSDEEQQQQMKKMNSAKFQFHLCRRLAQVFAFIDWSLGSMEIRRATDGNGAPLMNGCQLLKDLIQTDYVDRSVIEFLERNHIGSSGTTLLIDTDNNQSRSWRIIQQTIWPLFKDNICGFYLWPTQWRRLRQISPTILYDCANLRSIDSEYFPKFPAEDNAGASSALAKWLVEANEVISPISFFGTFTFLALLRCKHFVGLPRLEFVSDVIQLIMTLRVIGLAYEIAGIRWTKKEDDKVAESICLVAGVGIYRPLGTTKSVCKRLVIAYSGNLSILFHEWW